MPLRIERPARDSALALASHRADRRRTHRRTREASCRLGHAMTAPRIRTLMTTRSQVRESPRHPQTSSRRATRRTPRTPSPRSSRLPRANRRGDLRKPLGHPRRGGARHRSSILIGLRVTRRRRAWGFVVASGGVSSRPGVSSASSLAALFVDSGRIHDRWIRIVIIRTRVACGSPHRVLPGDARLEPAHEIVGARKRVDRISIRARRQTRPETRSEAPRLRPSPKDSGA